MITFGGTSSILSTRRAISGAAISIGLAVLALIPATASAAPGAFDTSFSSDGMASLSSTASSVTPEHMIIDPSSRIITASTATRIDASGHTTLSVEVSRTLANGAPDLAFGAGGVAAITTTGSIVGLVTTSSGGVDVVTAGAKSTSVHRLTSAGRADSAFGSAGTATAPGALYDTVNVVRAPDGGLVIGGTIHDSASGLNTWAVFKLLSNGSRATTFGTNGVTRINAGNGHATDIDVRTDGRILLSGIVDAGTSTQGGIARLTSAGKIDTGFGGTDGIQQTGYNVLNIASRADGKIVATSYVNNGSTVDSTDIAVYRYAASGAIDRTFGANGVTVIRVTDGADWPIDIAASGANTVVAGEAVIKTDPSKRRPVVLRLNAAGNLDAGFGDGGLRVGTPGNGVTYNTVDMKIDPAGRIVYTTESTAYRVLHLRYLQG